MGRRGGWRQRAVAGVCVVLAASACTGEDAVPIVPGVPSSEQETPHLLEPTDQMRDLAEQQCLDDPSLDVAEVNAVDPANSDQVLATVTIDCDEVR